jgi:ornithine cyclodeaminase
MSFDFRVINKLNVQNIINENFSTVFDLIGKTYLKFFQNEAINPPSYFLRFPDKPDARIIALPSYIQGDPDVAGLKWISSFPNNIVSGIQRASSVFILNDATNGYPLACLESSYISAFRTASSAILATERILNNQSQKSSLSIAIIGAGYIAETILDLFAARGWRFSQINIYDQDDKHSTVLSKKINHKGLGAIVCYELFTAISTADIVVFTTTEAQPYIDNFEWFENNPLVLNISLRDLAPNILYNSINYVDDIEHVLQANTSPHLTYKQYGHHEFITGTIKDLLLNKTETTAKKPIIFSPMGMGVLDLAVADYIYRKALKNDMGEVISDFFGDFSR